MANQAIVRTLYEDLNTGKLDQIPQLFAQEPVTIHGVGVHGEVGVADFGKNLAGLRSAFPDIHYTVEDVVEDGDRVAIRWTWSGTHEGPFRGFPPTGKQVKDSGIAIYQLENGKIKSAWLQTNRLGFWQQIGALPSEISPATSGSHKKD